MEVFGDEANCGVDCNADRRLRGTASKALVARPREIGSTPAHGQESRRRSATGWCCDFSSVVRRRSRDGRGPASLNSASSSSARARIKGARRRFDLLGGGLILTLTPFQDLYEGPGARVRATAGPGTTSPRRMSPASGRSRIVIHDLLLSCRRRSARDSPKTRPAPTRRCWTTARRAAFTRNGCARCRVPSSRPSEACATSPGPEKRRRRRPRRRRARAPTALGTTRSCVTRTKTVALILAGLQARPPSLLAGEAIASPAPARGHRETRCAPRGACSLLRTRDRAYLLAPVVQLDLPGLGSST